MFLAARSATAACDRLNHLLPAASAPAGDHLCTVGPCAAQQRRTAALAGRTCRECDLSVVSLGACVLDMDLSSRQTCGVLRVAKYELDAWVWQKRLEVLK